MSWRRTKCAIAHCCATENEFSDMKLFRFPKKGTVKYDEWLALTEESREHIKCLKKSYICIKHFENAFLGKKYLKTNAYPSLFLKRSESVPNSEHGSVCFDPVKSKITFENYKDLKLSSSEPTIGELNLAPKNLLRTKFNDHIEFACANCEAHIKRQSFYIRRIEKLKKLNNVLRITIKENRKSKPNLLKKIRRLKEDKKRLQAHEKQNIQGKIDSLLGIHQNAMTFSKLILSHGKNEYTEEEKWISQCIFFRSAAGYNFLRDQLEIHLPHPSSLHRWIKIKSLSPGLNRNVMQEIKEITSKLPPKEKEVVVIYRPRAVINYYTDTVAEVKINSSTEPSNNSLDNTINSQKHGAECSSTIYINDEKDDLLEKIEELCSDKSENIRNSENIYKSSEREFLRKIEEIEKNENKVSDLSNDKPNTNAELKAKQILECEATTIDSIIIGDKVLEVKDDSSREIDDPPIIVTSSDEIEKTVIAESVEPINENSLPPSGKEITASLSILKSDESKHDLTNDKIECPQANSLIHEEQMETLQNIEQKNPTEENLESNRISLEVNEANKVDVGKSLAKQYIEKSNKTKNHQPYDADENSGKNEKIEKKGIEEVNITGNAKKDETFNEICYEDIKSTNADNKVTVVPCNNNEKVHEISTTESHQNENKTIGAKLKENIVSCNLSNTEVSSSNMFYNTSIEKKIDMSENISEVSDALQLNFINKDEEDSEKLSNIKSENSTTEAEACDTSEIKQHSPDDATQQSVDGLKTYNGIPDTTMVEQDIKDKLNINKNMETDDCSITDLKNKFTYEVNVYSEQNDLRYLSIERVSSSCSEKKLDINKSSLSENSMQSTSNDSVNSSAVITDMQALNTATPASTSFRSLTSKIKHNILGIEELCNFMINEFTKIKHANLSESPKLTTVLETSKMSTPISQSKKSKMTRSYAEIPSTSASKLKHVRKRSIQEDDFDISPKVKHAKRDLSKETQKPDTIPEKESITVRPCVLAKWVDKKFYAGKITAEKPGNKYVVLFEDGASKTLPKESIVFGEGDVLPLQDQQVYALIDEDYESGTVLSIENVNNKTLYCIKTDRTTVKVTSSDIYLEVDQAKEIQKLQNLKVGDGIEEDESLGPRPSRNKRPPVSPSTPEGGYTGAAGKRGGKRQKRINPNSNEQMSF